jgi:hypothetical protein
MSRSISSKDLRDDPVRTAGILVVAADHPGALGGKHSNP